MSPSAVGKGQSINFSFGDDPIILAQSVQFLRSDALNSSLSTAAESVRLQTNRVYMLYTTREKLATLPNGANDKTKVLGGLATADALLKNLGDLGYKLETQKWLYVSSETFDASGKRIASQDKHLATPEELKALGYELVSTDSSSGQETYMHKANEGKSDETVTYMYVQTREGQVTASADAVAALLKTMEATIAIETDKLSASLVQLAKLMEGLDICIQTGDETISKARHVEELANDARVEDRRLQDSKARAKNSD